MKKIKIGLIAKIGLSVGMIGACLGPFVIVAGAIATAVVAPETAPIALPVAAGAAVAGAAAVVVVVRGPGSS